MPRISAASREEERKKPPISREVLIPPHGLAGTPEPSGWSPGIGYLRAWQRVEPVQLA